MRGTHKHADKESELDCRKLGRMHVFLSQYLTFAVLSDGKLGD